MIELENVTKSYPMGDSVVRALRGVTLKIEDGDFVAIMGPSGSGKSTLTQILGLLDVPSSGSYKISEREVEGLDEDHLARLRREEIGFVFQQFNLLPRMSAIDNVSLPLMYSGREIDDKISGQLLEQVGLGDREDHWPSELSGGQQQRVAIARALVNRPRIVIADEPTGNLDSVSEKEIMKVLSELNGRGITLIIVTHEEEIGQQANRIVRLRDGVIVGDERIRPIGVPSAALSSKDLTPSSEEKAKQGIGFLRELFIHANQGFRALAANKIRTALSMLGILIGVAAVVAMLALGRGAQTSIEKQLASLGSNLLVMRPGAMRIGGVSQEAGASTRITLDDVSALRNQISEIKDLAPTVSGRAQIVYMNKNWSTQVQGVMPAYVRMHASVPTEGRMFTDDEELSRARVAVIGQTLVRELFGDKGPIGEMIKVNKVSFQVIGVAPEKGSNGFRDQDDIILVPLRTAMHRLLGKDYVDSVEIEVRTADELSLTQDRALEVMMSRKRIPVSQQDEAFSIRNMADIQAALTESSKTMSLLLASIAAISLLVGGIGIMNIMLVSVTERTREIGLRKAVGARRRDIVLQFLAESVVVSVVGGLLGIVLAWIITIVLGQLAGWVTSVSLQSVLLAFFFSATIGVVFGIYPAVKASRLSPIDALRAA